MLKITVSTKLTDIQRIVYAAIVAAIAVPLAALNLYYGMPEEAGFIDWFNEVALVLLFIGLIWVFNGLLKTEQHDEAPVVTHPGAPDTNDGPTNTPLSLADCDAYAGDLIEPGKMVHDAYSALANSALGAWNQDDEEDISDLLPDGLTLADLAFDRLVFLASLQRLAAVARAAHNQLTTASDAEVVAAASGFTEQEYAHVSKWMTTF